MTGFCYYTAMTKSDFNLGEDKNKELMTKSISIFFNLYNNKKYLTN